MFKNLQMQNKELQAETKDDSEQMPIVASPAQMPQKPLLNAAEDLEYESPYCPTCESCGYDGCCSFVKCFRKLIENDKCDNGSQYLADAIFNRTIMQLADEVINKLENGLFDAKLAVEQYRKEWHEIYDKVYKADG